HHPEIDIDGDTATGIWYLSDTVIFTETRQILTGAAFYEDRYRRGADGEWRISRTGYTRTYEAMQSLDDTPTWQLLAHR
ncbi:nuclear transport factor 2 family protein, partial [Nocardia tengchongensis]